MALYTAQLPELLRTIQLFKNNLAILEYCLLHAYHYHDVSNDRTLTSIIANKMGWGEEAGSKARGGAPVSVWECGSVLVESLGGGGGQGHE